MNMHEYAERVEGIREKLYRTAVLCLGSASDAEEALDEAVYRGLKACKRLREPAFFDTWMTRILLNVCYDEHRRRRREQSFEELPETSAEAFDALPPSAREKALPLAGRDFTPGQLAAALEAGGLTGDALKACVRDLLAGALAEPNATFGEGYWCDHWTYSLDLIENLLSVRPEKKRELLFGAADYPWYETKAVVLPHALRAEKTARDGGTVLRQTRFLDMERKAAGGGKWMREAYGKGDVARSTLMEKILLLCAVKYAARDRAGIGIEMEGGKPGWYDALNGLPGIFGSSVADACELKRLIAYAARIEHPGCFTAFLILQIIIFHDAISSKM